ncbi:hypothetical protein RY654_003282 [Escherichia coli]|nr:hypothetical protein [Escherichia coli]
MSQLNWREYPANIPGPERHGSPLYLVRIEYDGTEAIVYDWFIRRPSDEEIETRNLGVDYPDDYVGEWSENENVTHWIPASELLATVTPPKRSGAIFDVAEERARQVFGEDFDYKRDDAYVKGELVDAALSYAMNATHPIASVAVPYLWPWNREWFKPTDRRRDLVKSAALLVAEIERLDRMPTDLLPVNQATIKQPSSNSAPDPLWWFSWYTSPGADGVPVGATLGRELSDKVFGYWCSGSDMADRLTMVAMVSAADEAAATALIVNEFGAFDELRFCEPKNLQRDDEGNLCRDQHGSGRFPLDDRGMALLNSWVAATLGAE